MNRSSVQTGVSVGRVSASGSGSGLVMDSALRADTLSMLRPGEWATLRGHRPYPWQFDVLNALGMDGSQVLLRTCNESGKTAFVIALLVKWHMETFRGSLTITTSASYGQIINQLYPSLRSKCRGDVGWKIMKDSAVYEPTGSRLVSFSTDDAGRAEGYHEPPAMDRFGLSVGGEKNPLSAWGVEDCLWSKVLSKNTSSLLIVVDEAKSVKGFVYEGLERCHPTRYLVASSPGGAEGKFWDFCNREKSRFTYMRHVSYEECPHLVNSKRHMREKAQQESTLDEWLVKSIWYGEFAAVTDKGVFNMVSVDRAMSNTVPLWGRGCKRAAFDPSGGGDEVPLYYRDGNACRLVKTWREPDDEKLAVELIEEFRRLQLKPEMVVADDGGLGKLLLNNLSRKGWPVNRIDFGGKARNERYYANCRAEMYCELANRIKHDEVRLPFDEQLREQLGWQKRINNENPIRLVPKGTMPHSPDRADTVVMLYYDMPEAVEFEDRQRQLDFRLSPTRSDPNAEHLKDYSPLHW